MDVDAVFDQDPEHAFIIAIARYAPTHAIRLNDPQPERLALPDRFRRQTPHLHDGEYVAIFRDPLDKLV